MRTIPFDGAPRVLHGGRHLNEILVSTVAELTAAVGNSAVDKILVAAGTYNFTTTMCTGWFGSYTYGLAGTNGQASTDGSAICINRAVTIEAQVPGSVVLNAGSVVRRSLPRWPKQNTLSSHFLEGGLRVLEVESGGTARLIGLNITGGYAAVRSVALLNTCALELTLELTGCCERAHCFGVAVCECSPLNSHIATPKQ